MMKPKQRELLKVIERVWEAEPSLRLTQLIGNCFGPGDLYYVTDEMLAAGLNRTYPEQRK